MRRTELRRLTAAIIVPFLVAACGSTAQVGMEGALPADAGGTAGLELSGGTETAAGGFVDDGLGDPGVAGDDGLGAGGDAGATAAGGSATSGATGGSTTTTSGGTAGGTSGGGSAGSGGGRANGGGAGPSGGKEPGLTADKIHIGFAYSENANAANDSAGVEGASRGDQQRFSELMIKWVNRNGGIFGREVVPVYHVYDGASAQSAPEQEQAACATYTQDNEVFAVATSAQATLIACLHKAGIPHFNVQGMRGPQEDLLAQWPRYFEVANVELNTVARSQIKGLWDKGYFKPLNPTEQVKIGLVRYDEPGFRRSTREAFIPALQRRGLKLHQEAEISAPQSLGDYSGLSAQVQSAILRFQREGINRVMFMEASGDLALFWMTTAEGQGYRPRYGLTSNDAGEILADNVPHAQLENALGIGWSPGSDTRGKYALPAWPARKLCRKIFAEGGYEFSDLNEEGVAMLYCDGTRFTQAAAGASPAGATRAGIVAGAERLGTSFSSAAGNGPTLFTPKRHFGITKYRTVKWVTDCECFQYTGGPYRMP